MMELLHGMEFLWKYVFRNTLLSEIFAGRKFCGSQKPQIFCILAELNFAVYVFEPILRECNFAVEWKFWFSILMKNNFIEWKERYGENDD